MAIKIKIIENLDEVQKLYKIVYPLNDADKFKWLYNDNPRGKANIVAAYDSSKSKIIGALAIIPMLTSHKGTQLLIGQAIDGMIHPEYRGRRIFDILIEDMFTQAKGKYKYLIGFPNQMSRKKLIKKGWVIIGNFVNWSFPINSKAVVGTLTEKPIIGPIVEMIADLPIKIYDNYHLKISKQSNTNIVEIKNKQIKIDNIVSLINNINPIMLVRDPDFIRWRLQSLPINNYRIFYYYNNEELLGYFCYKSVNQSAEVVDFIISPEPKNIEGALCLLIEQCRKEQLNAVHFQLSKYAYCNPSLKKCGFIKRKSDQIIIIYPTNPKNKIPDYKSCYINLADTDWV